MFDRDQAASDAVTLDEWQRRTLDQRFKEWFARVWEYWL
jgi:cardiolipin synthase